MIAEARGAQVTGSDLDLVERIGQGDDDAFADLVDRYGAALLRVAAHHSPNRAVAEEVVQETWMAFLHGLSTFEGRSTLRTWLFGILFNQARKLARRERHTVRLDPPPDSDEDHGVDSQRFMPADGRWAGHWRLDDLSAWPRAWDELPENRVLQREVRTEIDRALEHLPAAQRLVFTLRDVEGMTAREVCDVLDVSAANERVLLHRARCKIRAHVEAYLDA